MLLIVCQWTQQSKRKDRCLAAGGQANELWTQRVKHGSGNRLGLLVGQQHRVIPKANYAEQKQPDRRRE